MLLSSCWLSLIYLLPLFRPRPMKLNNWKDPTAFALLLWWYFHMYFSHSHSTTVSQLPSLLIYHRIFLMTAITATVAAALFYRHYHVTLWSDVLLRSVHAVWQPGYRPQVGETTEADKLLLHAKDEIKRLKAELHEKERQVTYWRCNVLFVWDVTFLMFLVDKNCTSSTNQIKSGIFHATYGPWKL